MTTPSLYYLTTYQTHGAHGHRWLRILIRDRLVCQGREAFQGLSSSVFPTYIDRWEVGGYRSLYTMIGENRGYQNPIVTANNRSIILDMIVR